MNLFIIFVCFITFVKCEFQNLTEPQFARSLTVNKGTSTGFSVNANDLFENSTKEESTNSTAAEIINSPKQENNPYESIDNGNHAELQPRPFFQRIKDVLFSVGIFMLMAAYNAITSYYIGLFNPIAGLFNPIARLFSRSVVSESREHSDWEDKFYLINRINEAIDKSKKEFEDKTEQVSI